MNDIKTKEDIVRLVDEFYDKVLQSALIAKIFENVDWPNHKPIMYSFWSTMILGDQSYKRNPFEKHMPLKLTEKHFEEWLRLFHLTVDELFEGSKALEAKERARTIAN
ncbi:MAG TPA: group III truncated hemoglobin, partial [Cyclobacteriaceae bacterium]